MQKSVLFACAALAAVTAPQLACASGFAVEHQNAKAMGAAYAGAQAQAGDAGFAVYNPASLAGLARPEVVANATILWGKTSYDNASGVLLGSFSAGGASADDRVLPEAFVLGSAIAAPLSDRLVVGLTLTTPFGLRSQYDVNSAVRYHAQDAELLTMTAAPTLAYQLTDRIALGASLKIEYMDLTASTVVDAGGVAFLNGVTSFTPGSSDLFAEFKGDDVAVGFSAGLQAEIAEGVRVGFSYTSGMTHDYRGGVTFERPGSAAAQALNRTTGLFADSPFSSSLKFPGSYSLGVAVRACDCLTLLASASLTRWSVFDQVVFDFDNPVQPNEVITADWKDSFAFSVGADWRFSDKLSARGGFSFDETPIRDDFAGPRIPDTDRRWLMAGLTHAIGERMTLDFAAGFNVAPKTRHVRLDGAAPGDLLRGALTADIDVNTYVVSLRSKYRF